MLLSAERVRAAGVLKLLGRQMWARRVHQAVDGKHQRGVFVVCFAFAVAVLVVAEEVQPSDAHRVLAAAEPVCCSKRAVRGHLERRLGRGHYHRLTTTATTTAARPVRAVEKKKKSPPAAGPFLPKFTLGRGGGLRLDGAPTGSLSVC